VRDKAIVLDVDGVILNSDFILQEIHEKGLKGDEMWDYFYANCNSDRVQLMPNIKEFIRSFGDVKLIISTARSEKVRPQTARKLTKHRIFFDEMYMRDIDDLSSASCVKREHLDDIIKDYDIIAFIDDDLTNCQMAKELGILSLRKV
jgi:FMN phosphatase YigB (HAD superfamily)